jgi:phenylacetate-CoA ligase
MPDDPTTQAAAERREAVDAAIPRHLDRLTWSAERLAAHQRTALRALLRAAVDGSPFHAERLRGVDPSRVELADLPRLPTMTKAEMMASFDDVVTDPRIDRRTVESHLAGTGVEASELLGEHLVLASGGSSGERGVFVYPRAAAVDYLLGLRRAGLARIIAMLGALPAEPVPVALVAAGSAVHATRALASLFSDDRMPVTSIPATAPLDEIVRRVDEASPLLLIGYPSVLGRLADEKLAGRLHATPLSVTTTSEALAPTIRARLDEAFGVGVCDMFGSSEGLLGVSPPDDPAIVLASDLAIVELVDEEHRPVPPGTRSAKILLTNLFNPLQPLIRYELTDEAVRHADAREHGHLRVTVDGRADDELRWDGVTVPAIAVRSVLVQAAEVVEYQVRQTAAGLDAALVAPDGVDAEPIRAGLTAALATAGLAAPRVTVHVVAPEQIERHPATGKTRRIIARRPSMAVT